MQKSTLTNIFAAAAGVVIASHILSDYRRFKTERASRKAAGESDSQRNAPRKKTKHYQHVRAK